VKCREVMSKEEREEMKEEEKKESLFACVQRWLENLPDLADFPGKYERAVKEMIKKKQEKGDYKNEMEKLKRVQLLYLQLPICL